MTAEAMADEFDTMAKWTADAVEQLGIDHAIPAGCRGSGSPAGLEWLAGELGLGAGVRFLDCGAGVGGPAELAARRYRVAPVLAEPMIDACRASARLFGRPVVVAAGERLPFAGRMFDAAWCLGVLCTVPNQASLLAELRRVLRPGASLGLLVFVRTVERLAEQPEGNYFPTGAELDALLDGAGLRVRTRAELAGFPDPAPDWQAAVERVDAAIEAEHGTDARWQTAQHQQRLIGKLISDGLVTGRLIAAKVAG